MNIFRDSNSGITTKILTIVLCFFVSFFIGQVISTIVVNITDFKFTDLGSITTEMTHEIKTLKWLQFISSFFTFVLPPVLIGLIFEKNLSGFLKLGTTPNILYYCFVLLFMFASMPLLHIIIEWNNSISLPTGLESYLRNMENSNQHVMDLMLTGNSYLSLTVNILLIALLPAIGEEFFFRGIIQTYFTRWVKNAHISIFITAIIFSAVHFQFYGFIPRFLLGLFFGYMVYATGSLWPAIFAHFANNSMAVIADFVTRNNDIQSELDFGSQASDIWYIFIATVIAILIGRYLFRKKKTEL